jgi:DNA-binding XRE family transcriptional regulator
VRELRAGAGLTQAAAAAALGINRQTYIQFEKRSPLPAHLIVAFADLVGVDVRKLLTPPENAKESKPCRANA